MSSCKPEHVFFVEKRISCWGRTPKQLFKENKASLMRQKAVQCAFALLLDHVAPSHEFAIVAQDAFKSALRMQL